MDKKKSINLFVLFFLFAIPFIGVAQPITLLIEMGDKYAEANKHTEAINVYKSVLERDETNIAGQYKIAESYRAILDYETAQGYYQKVKRRNDGRFLLAGYYYALMTKLNGDYVEAMTSFEEFMALLKEREQHEDERFRQYYEQARIEREGTLIALNETSEISPDHQFTLLPKPINSDAMDSAPSTYTNDSTLVISSGRKGGKGAGFGAFGESWNDLYRYSKDKGEWDEVKIKDDFEDINDKYEDAAGMFNTERNKFYFTRCEPVSETAINCAIYVSSLQGGDWSEPIKLNSNINSRGSNSRQSSVTVSGDSLFFCSDREGGYGNYDIYLSTKFGDENWGYPINLGSQINTLLNESSPFYDHKDQTLFFSSNGHRGFGGYDIFLADGSSFEKAEIYNVGKPYNSFRDDMFFFLGEHSGYMSSNRDGGVGKMDIYRFRIETETEIITEIESDMSIAGRNSLFSDDYDFDSGDDEMLSEIISHLMASSVADVDMALTDDQLSFYNSLSKDDQERIDRIVNARVRNLSQNDLNSIRDEDEFFYSSMQSDDKRHLDNLVSAYVREDGLGLSLAIDQEEKDYYENLSVEDKEKVDMIIATRMKQAEDFQFPTTEFDGLDQQSQQSVSQLSMKVISDKKNIENMALAFNENLFIRNNQDNPELINNTIKEKIYTLADDPKYELKEEDRIFYQNLDSKQLTSLQNIASSVILNDVNNIESSISKEDLAIYNAFSTNQKQQLDKILAKIISNTIKADLYLGEANFEKNEVATAKLNRNIEAAFNYLKTNDTPLFNSLSQKNHRAIKRFISVSEPWINSPSNIYLPLGEVQAPVAIVDRGPQIADVMSGESPYVQTQYNSGTNTLQNLGSENSNEFASSANLSTIDLTTYQNLTSAQKGAVNRSIGSSILSNAYSQNTSLPVSDTEYYATLNANEKSFVQLLQKQLAGQELTSKEKISLASAMSYYQHLPVNEKGTMSRVIVKEVLKAYRKANSYGISPQDQQLIAGLSAMEKSAVDNISKYLTRINSLILDDNDINSSLDQKREVLAIIPSNINNQSSQLNITGFLLDSRTNTAFSNTQINLVSRNGVPVKEITTTSSGSFSITGVPNSEYHLEIASPNQTHVHAYVNNLNVTGTGIAAQNSNIPGNPITSNDVSLYKSFDPAKKRAIDLSIASEILNKVYSNNPYQALSDQQFYNTLADKEKEYIRILAKDLKRESFTPSESALNASAYSYYRHLIPAEKPFWSRLITIEALKELKVNDTFMISESDQSIIAGLSYAEKNTYDRILGARALDAPFFTESLESDSKILINVLISGNSNSTSNINGDVVSVKTEIPAANHPLNLVHTETNQTVSSTSTNDKGQFEFNDISKGGYSINTSESSSNSNEENTLYVRNLKMSNSQNVTTIDSPTAASSASSDPIIQEGDFSFYSNLNETSRKAIDRGIAAELITEAYQTSTELVSDDTQYLKSLSSKEKDYLNLLAKDLNSETLPNAQLPALAVAYSYLRQLSGDDQQAWNRLVTAEAQKAYKTGNSYGISSQDKTILEGLSNYEQVVYDRIKKARRISGPLTEGSIVAGRPKDVLLYIPKITGNQGDQLEISGKLNESKPDSPAPSVQLILADYDGNIISRTTTTSSGEFKFDRAPYGNHSIRVSDPDSQSSTQGNLYVSDLTMKNVKTQNLLTRNQVQGDVSPVAITSGTLSSYQNLPRTDKRRIDRLIAFDYLTQAYKENPSLKTSDNQAYKALNNQEEKYIKILTMDLRGDELSVAEQSLLSSAFSYYYNVAESRKAIINRLVADALFSQYKQGNNYRLISSDASYKSKMDTNVQLMLENIKAFRFNNERILSENLEIESKDLGNRQVVLNIPNYTNNEFSRISISGRLIDTQTGNPVATKALRVVDEAGVMIARTFSSSNGTFKFNGIRAGNYHIEVEQPSSVGSQTESYFVKDLEISGTHGISHAHFKTFNIYYDFNDFQLRPEAKKALADLGDLAKNQEIVVELKAHTDAVGNSIYNDELSGKRGATAMDFLTGFGLSPDDITLLAYGKSDPVASNTDEYGRQFNRRVEVIIKSHQPIRYNPPTVYLIRPKATLYSISKNFNLTVDEVMKMNGLTEPSINAYHPLRIENPMNYKPNLDMLVELNESVSTTNSFKYVVKSGETTTSIAEKFNLPEELLLEMNGLTTHTLRKGQQLNIYIRY